MGSKFYPVSEFITNVIGEIPGFTPVDELLSLHSLVIASSCIGGDILEIGSWCGRSTVVMAHALSICGEGKLISVDLFPNKNDWIQNDDKSWSFYTENGIAYHDQTVWDAPYQREIAPLYENNESILDIFLSNINKYKFNDIVHFHKGTVNNLETNNYFRLCFIDGDHSYNSVYNDINYCVNHMPYGGFICFDDAFSSYDGVDSAIKDNLLINKRMVFHQQLTRKFHIVKILPEGCL